MRHERHQRSPSQEDSVNGLPTQTPGFMEWIEHLHGKTWGRESMGDFVDAVLTISQYGYMKDKTHVSVHRELAKRSGGGMKSCRAQD